MNEIQEKFWDDQRNIVDSIISCYVGNVNKSKQFVSEALSFVVKGNKVCADYDYGDGYVLDVDFGSNIKKGSSYDRIEVSIMIGKIKNGSFNQHKRLQEYDYEDIEFNQSNDMNNYEFTISFYNLNQYAIEFYDFVLADKWTGTLQDLVN
jgi:hypothetical protein